MKKITLLLVFITSVITAQTNIEIYLFDIVKTDTGYKLINKKNVSNNKGYDSQPHFYDNNTLLFASTRNGQTDILKYTITTGEKKFINSTPNGGEYSPQRIPDSDNVSAVRLDKSGLQRFYEYNINTGNSTELIKDLVVAYPYWHNKNVLISSTIVDGNLNLILSDLHLKTNTTLDVKTGRSIHQIPNTNNVSYISKKDSLWEIKSLNIEKCTMTKIANTNGQYEDICWLSEDIVLQAKKNQISQLNVKSNSNWSSFFTFENGIENISRIIVSPDGSKIAIVGEVSPKLNKK